MRHPKDLQDGLVEVNEDDCLANVPYVEGCGSSLIHNILSISIIPSNHWSIYILSSKDISPPTDVADCFVVAQQVRLCYKEYIYHNRSKRRNPYDKKIYLRYTISHRKHCFSR